MIQTFRYYFPGLLNSMTRLVLVNAVYFKGTWEKKFDAAQTKPEKFHLNSNENKMIPMMKKKTNFGYLESADLDAKILRMNYKVSNILPSCVKMILSIYSKVLFKCYYLYCFSRSSTFSVIHWALHFNSSIIMYCTSSLHHFPVLGVKTFYFQAFPEILYI